MERKICKYCGTALVQKSTKPKASQQYQPYYYTAYYWCANCKRLYHDEKFKVMNQREEPSSQSTVHTTRINKVALHPHLDPLPLRERKIDVDIWTDGACVFNGQANARAAWGFVSGKTEHAGLVEGKQTNNVAEALAIYHALLWAADQGYKTIQIHSDSQITLHNLEKDPREIKNNQEIFQMIADVIAIHGLTVSYIKVTGHANDENNNRADKLANDLASGKQQ